jgi:hypothetical protein
MRLGMAASGGRRSAWQVTIVLVGESGRGALRGS